MLRCHHRSSELKRAEQRVETTRCERLKKLTSTSRLLLAGLGRRGSREISGSEVGVSHEQVSRYHSLGSLRFDVDWVDHRETFRLLSPFSKSDPSSPPFFHSLRLFTLKTSRLLCLERTTSTVECEFEVDLSSNSRFDSDASFFSTFSSERTLPELSQHSSSLSRLSSKVKLFRSLLPLLLLS